MPDEPAPRRPPLLVVIIAVVALEAGLLLGLAGYSLLAVVRGEVADVAVGVGNAALAVLIGGFLALSARGLWLRRRWARAPVITWQLLQLAVTAPNLARPDPWVTVALVAASAVVVVGLLTPAVTRATSSTADPPVT